MKTTNANKFENLDIMDKFLQKRKWLKVTWEQMENMNTHISTQQIKFIITFVCMYVCTYAGVYPYTHNIWPNYVYSRNASLV